MNKARNNWSLCGGCFVVIQELTEHCFLRRVCCIATELMKRVKWRRNQIDKMDEQLNRRQEADGRVCCYKNEGLQIQGYTIPMPSPFRSSARSSRHTKQNIQREHDYCGGGGGGMPIMAGISFPGGGGGWLYIPYDGGGGCWPQPP